MKIRFVSLAGVVALTVLAGLPLFGGFTGQAQLQETEAVVEPPVLDALEGDSEVAVIVSLKRPDLALGIPDVSELRGITAERQARVLSALTADEFQVTWQYEVIPALAGMITATRVEKLRSHGDVLRIYIPPVFSLDLSESVPLIRADEVHALGIDGTGVTVAVLDSGIDTDHPDLQDDIAGEECWLVDPESFPWPCPNGQVTQSGPGAAEDDLGHGTRVAGVITSDGNVAPVGVAPKAKIFAYKVCDANNQCPSANALAAFDDLLFNHLGEFASLNMSFGIATYGPGHCDDANFDMTFALSIVRATGTLPFASTGNQALKAAMKLPACIR